MSTRRISWGKGGRCVRLITYHHPVPLSRNMGTLTFWNPLGHSRSVTGFFYLYVLRNYSLYDFIHTPVTFPLLRDRAIGLAGSRCSVIVHTKVQSQASPWGIFDGVSSTENGFCPDTSAHVSFDSTTVSYLFFYHRI